MRASLFALLVLTMGVGTLTTKALAKHTTVQLLAPNVVSHSLNEAAPVYVLGVALPEELDGKRLDSVFLEFYVDVALVDTSVGLGPTIHVRPLAEEFSGEGQPSFEGASGASRALSIGSSRKVRLDITDIVRGWLADPETNHGLLVGSLGGSESGVFDLRDDVLGGDAIASVSFFYQNRFGERLSE